jgi:hypothetical protein
MRLADLRGRGDASRWRRASNAPIDGRTVHPAGFHTYGGLTFFTLFDESSKAVNVANSIGMEIGCVVCQATPISALSDCIRPSRGDAKAQHDFPKRRYRDVPFKVSTKASYILLTAFWWRRIFETNHSICFPRLFRFYHFERLCTPRRIPISTHPSPQDSRAGHSQEVPSLARTSSFNHAEASPLLNRMDLNMCSLAHEKMLSQNVRPRIVLPGSSESR